MLGSAVAGTAVTFAGCFGLTNRGNGGGDWPTFAFDARNSGHAPGSQVPSDGVGLEWSTSIAHDRVAQPAVVDGDVFVGTNRGRVVDLPKGRAVSLDGSGDERWSFEADSPLDTPTTVTNGGVFMGSGSGTVYAVDRDGTRRWQFDVGDGGCSVTATEETVYALEARSGVTALTPDGDRRWQFAPEGGASVRGVPAVGDRGAYTGGTRLVALDDGGRLRWRYGHDGYAVGTPVLGDDVVYAVEFDPESSIESPDRYVAAVDGTGDERWRSGLEGVTAVATTGSRLVASTTGGVVGLDPGSGDVQWRHDCAYPTRPGIADGTTVVATRTGDVRAVDAATGDRRWSHDLGGTVAAPPAIAGGALYVGTKSGEIRKMTG